VVSKPVLKTVYFVCGFETGFTETVYIFRGFKTGFENRLCLSGSDIVHFFLNYILKSHIEDRVGGHDRDKQRTPREDGYCIYLYLVTSFHNQ
jgi:hypothetical protein